MFKILRKSAQTGLVTIGYPEAPAQLSEALSRARPASTFPAGATRVRPPKPAPREPSPFSTRTARGSVTVDYGSVHLLRRVRRGRHGRAVRMTREFELAAPDRSNLVIAAEYAVGSDGVQSELTQMHRGYSPGRDIGDLGAEGERANPQSPGALACDP